MGLGLGSKKRNCTDDLRADYCALRENSHTVFQCQKTCAATITRILAAAKLTILFVDPKQIWELFLSAHKRFISGGGERAKP
jgi:hypothetical protein